MLSWPTAAKTGDDDWLVRTTERKTGGGGRRANTSTHSAYKLTQGMERWYSETHHLLRSHAHCLDCEFATTHIEKILKVRAQQVNYENVVKALLTEVVHLRYAGCIANVRQYRNAENGRQDTVQRARQTHWNGVP